MSRGRPAPTLTQYGLLVCPACHLVTSVGSAGPGGTPRATGTDEAPALCPRCRALLGGPLTPARRRRSLAATAALLAAAVALYVPANALPIMLTHSALGDRADTILSGVKLLVDDGSWPLALIVFGASFLVPLAKLGVLIYLLLAVRLRWRGNRRRRTALYRGIEAIGRWSMLDVFVVSILTALVQLGAAAEVSAGPGVLAFGGVVWLTIWATQAFDPRLIWEDGLNDDRGPAG